MTRARTRDAQVSHRWHHAMSLADVWVLLLSARFPSAAPLLAVRPASPQQEEGRSQPEAHTVEQGSATRKACRAWLQLVPHASSGGAEPDTLLLHRFTLHPLALLSLCRHPCRPLTVSLSRRNATQGSGNSAGVERRRRALPSTLECLLVRFERRARACLGFHHACARWVGATALESAHCSSFRQRLPLSPSRARSLFPPNPPPHSSVPSLSLSG